MVLYKVSDAFLSCLLCKRLFSAFIFNYSLNLGMVVSRTSYPRNVEELWGDLIMHTILTIAGVVLWILKVSKSVKGTIQYVHRENRSKLTCFFLTFLSIVSFLLLLRKCTTPHHTHWIWPYSHILLCILQEDNEYSFTVECPELKRIFFLLRVAPLS